MTARFGKYGVLGSLPGWGPIEAFRGHEIGASKGAGDVRLERVLLRDDAGTAEPLRSWTQVRHAGIVRVLDVFDLDGHRIVVRSFLEATSLDRVLDHVRLDGTPLPLDAALHVAASVAAAIADVGVWSGTPSIARAHGLITPALIFVERDGTVRLSGHAARLLLAEADDGTPEIRPGYALPGGERPPTECDAWALAALCFELFAGERPPLDPTRARLEGRETTASPELVGAIDATLAAAGDDRLRAAQRLAFRLRRAQRPDTGRAALKEFLASMPAEEDSVEDMIQGARAALAKGKGPAPKPQAEPAIVPVEPERLPTVPATRVAITKVANIGGPATEPPPPAPALDKAENERVPTAKAWAVQRAASVADADALPPVDAALEALAAQVLAAPLVDLVASDDMPALHNVNEPVPSSAPIIEARPLMSEPPKAVVVPDFIVAATGLPGPEPAAEPTEAASDPFSPAAASAPRPAPVSDDPAIVPDQGRRKSPGSPYVIPAITFLFAAAAFAVFGLVKSGMIGDTRGEPTTSASKTAAAPAVPSASAKTTGTPPAPSAEPTATNPATSAAPSISAAPSASASASVSATPSASATSSTPAPTTSSHPSSPLPAGKAWVTMTGPQGVVVLNGKKVGKSNEPIAMECGWPWIVLAEYDDKDRLVRTLSKSQQYTVKCGIDNVLVAAPK